MGDTLLIKQPKTRTYRRVSLNDNAVAAIMRLLASRDFADEDYLFQSQRRSVLMVPSVTNLVKGWCGEVGLTGNYGSHTLRKTWGYWQYQNRTSLPLLMRAFGHATEAQTLEYLCIQPAEIAEIYQLAL